MGGAHVIWTGPVSAEQRAGATIVGATEHFLPCVGSACRSMAEAWQDADGRHLPALLAQLGIPDGEDLFLGAFSAGGSAWKQLLQHPLDRAAIRAVALADATYELAGSDGRPASSPSLVAYASEAAASGRQFLLATASSNPNNASGVAQPSGADTLARIASDLEQSLGQTLAMQSFIPGQGLDDLQPARVWLAGGVGGGRNVVLCDFGAQFQHAQHATVLAPRLWPAVLQPWVDGGEGAGQVSSTDSLTPSSLTPDGAGADTSPDVSPDGGTGPPDPSADSTADPTADSDATITSSTPHADDSMGVLEVVLALGAVAGMAALVQGWRRRAVPSYPSLRRFR